MGKPKAHPCVKCAATFTNPADVTTDTTLVTGRHINLDGENRLFNGYLCDQHSNDMQWVKPPKYTRSKLNGRN